jgi:AcrR family transcriptional regulator
MPGDRDDDCRERLVDATLDLCMGQGYDATTVDQIAAAADVTPADFERQFATKDAAIMSVVDDLLQATPQHSPTLRPRWTQSTRCWSRPSSCWPRSSMAAAS